MKKILLITPGIFPVPATHGGAVEYLTQLYVDENDKKQHVILDVITISLDKNDEKQNNKYKNTNFIYINGMKKTFKFSRIIRYIINCIFPFYVNNAYIHEVIKKLEKNKKKYDEIIIENNPLFVKSIRQIYKDTPIVLHLHNDYLNDQSKHNKYILDNCTKVYAVSNYISSRVQTIYKTNKVEVVYNGIDLDCFTKKYSQNELEKCRKKYDITSSNFIFLYVGRLIPEKGVLELMHAFQQINKEFPTTKLLIVGSKSTKKSRMGTFGKKLLNLSKDNNNIIFTGYIDYNNIPLIYSISDVAIVPSKWGEPFGNVVVEGLASDTKQIVTNDGGISEIVKGTSASIIDKSGLTNNLYSEMKNLIEKNNKSDSSNDLKIAKQFSKESYIKNIFSKIMEVKK